LGHIDFTPPGNWLRDLTIRRNDDATTSSTDLMMMVLLGTKRRAAWNANLETLTVSVEKCGEECAGSRKKITRTMLEWKQVVGLISSQPACFH